MKNEEELAMAVENVNDRRKFLKSAGFTGLGMAAAGLAAAGKVGALDNTPVGRALGLKTQNVDAAGITDGDILNFALNLEYLEAEFYTVATTGKYLGDFGFITTGTGTAGSTYGGKQVVFPQDQFLSEELSRAAHELREDEQAHVELLRSALGSYAVAKPEINLGALGPKPFQSFQGFLVLARAFEDVGVSAYIGAAPLITSKAYLGVAAQIAATEALHAGSIRTFVDLTYTKTSALDSLDVVPRKSGTQFFTTDANALAITRTTSQVLSIVYGSSGTGTSRGGFYPMGMNGVIKAV